MSRILITIFLPLLVYLSYQGCRNRGGWSPPTPPVFGRSVTLSQPGGQVMPTTLLSATGFSDLPMALHVHWHTLMLFVKFQSGNWATHHFLNGHNDKPTKIGHNFRLMIFSKSLLFTLLSDNLQSICRTSVQIICQKC